LNMESNTVMNITVSDQDNIKIINLEGDLDTGTSPHAQETLSGILSEGATRLVLDMEKINYISSAGLRVLLVIAKQCGAAGGELRICGLNEMAREVFDISGFSSILNVFPTRQEALAGI